MSTKIKLVNGRTITVYGAHTKEDLKMIKALRNNQIIEAQSRADIKRDNMFKCQYCGGNGCTLCGW